MRLLRTKILNKENNPKAFIEYFLPRDPANSVAVKDVIDIKGHITSAGSQYIFETTQPAQEDAACLLPLRQAGIELTGKTNLVELAFGTTGKNEWSGTPVNPMGQDIIPGGSSSGSAVAVAMHMCKFALGTDTGGSLRIPPACCGVAGLKPTFGLISTIGVRPLAPSMDVVGPIARNVNDLKEAFSLLTPDFPNKYTSQIPVTRLRIEGVAPEIEEAIDNALNSADIKTSTCPISTTEWSEMVSAGDDILWAEAAEVNNYLRDHWSQLQSGDRLKKAVQIGEDTGRMQLAKSRRAYWSSRLREIIAEHGVIVTPTLECLPPTFEEAKNQKPKLAYFTIPVNLTGLPAVVIPIPSKLGLPSSLQLIGPEHSELMLLDLAKHIESYVRLKGSKIKVI